MHTIAAGLAVVFGLVAFSAWLNFANDAFTLTTMVDTDGVGGADTPFGTVMAQAEAARLNPATAPAVLLAFKNMLERINQ